MIKNKQKINALSITYTFKIISKFIILVIYTLERKILLHECLLIGRKIITSDMHSLVM